MVHRIILGNWAIGYRLLGDEASPIGRCFGMVFASYVCEMIHLHHEYINNAMKRGLTMHHHLVCAVGNNAMKHSYIVPPPPAASACCMVLPLYVSWSPSSYCFVQLCGRFFMGIRNKEPGTRNQEQGTRNQDLLLSSGSRY